MTNRRGGQQPAVERFMAAERLNSRLHWADKSGSSIHMSHDTARKHTHSPCAWLMDDIITTSVLPPPAEHPSQMYFMSVALNNTNSVFSMRCASKWSCTLVFCITSGCRQSEHVCVLESLCCCGSNGIILVIIHFYLYSVLFCFLQYTRLYKPL